MGGELQRMLQGYNIEIEAFIDNSREKWGGEKNGITIHAPDYLEGRDDLFVIIAMMDVTEVKKQLSDMKIPHISTIAEMRRLFWNVQPLKVEI
jgi:hypothetical protein